jgi:hypothetical protein
MIMGTSQVALIILIPRYGYLMEIFQKLLKLTKRLLSRTLIPNADTKTQQMQQGLRSKIFSKTKIASKSSQNTLRRTATINKNVSLILGRWGSRSAMKKAEKSLLKKIWASLALFQMSAN